MKKAKCKLIPDGEYDHEWCLEVNGAAQQCKSCPNYYNNAKHKRHFRSAAEEMSVFMQWLAVFYGVL